MRVGESTQTVDSYIVERVKGAVHTLKACDTEEQRREYGILLRALAPPLVKRGNMHGMLKKAVSYTHLTLPTTPYV